MRKLKPELKVGFIGWGAIATRVAELLEMRKTPGVTIAAVAVRDRFRERSNLPDNAVLIGSPCDLDGLELDMIVECAGRDAVGQWGEAALRHAERFVVSSTSAFCDDQLLAQLTSIAEQNGSRIVVPSGALGDLGALAAASVLPLDKVTHQIIKPPKGWIGTRAEDILDLQTLDGAQVFFEGSAREAASAYPQNANVAVISALSGIGLDRTRVELVADPAVTRNSHEVVAEGAFGRLSLRLENEPLATNPKSSEMTALSLVRLLENAVSPIIL